MRTPPLRLKTIVAFTRCFPFLFLSTALDYPDLFFVMIEFGGERGGCVQDFLCRVLPLFVYSPFISVTLLFAKETPVFLSFSTKRDSR